MASQDQFEDSQESRILLTESSRLTLFQSESRPHEEINSNRNGDILTESESVLANLNKVPPPSFTGITVDLEFDSQTQPPIQHMPTAGPVRGEKLSYSTPARPSRPSRSPQAPSTNRGMPRPTTRSPTPLDDSPTQLSIPFQRTSGTSDPQNTNTKALYTAPSQSNQQSHSLESSAPLRCQKCKSTEFAKQCFAPDCSKIRCAQCVVQLCTKNSAGLLKDEDGDLVHVCTKVS